jgi:hypothetical protein
LAGVQGVRFPDMVEASTNSLIPHPATFPHCCVVLSD